MSDVSSGTPSAVTGGDLLQHCEQGVAGLLAASISVTAKHDKRVDLLQFVVYSFSIGVKSTISWTCSSKKELPGTVSLFRNPVSKQTFGRGTCTVPRQIPNWQRSCSQG